MPPITEPHTPKAIARSRPWNCALTEERVAGRMAAPPTPCRMRAPISAAPLCEMAASRLASAKITMPTRNTRRRPMRSPRRPSVRSSAANTSG